MVWSVFRGPILGDQSGREAFPCSVALVFSFFEAFSYSAAIVFRLSDFRKRYKNNGLGVWRSFRGSSGDPWGRGLGDRAFGFVAPQVFVTFRILYNRVLAFSRGPGGFRELREAGRKHFHLSWYLLVPGVTSYDQKPWGEGNLFYRLRSL